jgi:hypothetical protein
MNTAGSNVDKHVKHRYFKPTLEIMQLNLNPKEPLNAAELPRLQRDSALRVATIITKVLARRSSVVPEPL